MSAPEDRAEAYRRDADASLGEARALSAGHPELERLLRLANSTALLGVLEVLRRLEDRLAGGDAAELARLRQENAELRQQLEVQRGYAERLRGHVARLQRGRPWP